jgi:serine/threonine protein kinase
MIANDITQDTERTVLLAGGNNALPVGTRLDEFEIIGLVGEGGFGIVYLAHDHALERRVALKEYMPSALVSRVGRTHVSLKSEHHRGTFETGLRSFVNEARLLARFDHPSLVKVYRFWEAHGTAYMTMPFYEGETLRDHLHRLRKPPAEAWLMERPAPSTSSCWCRRRRATSRPCARRAATGS